MVERSDEEGLRFIASQKSAVAGLQKRPGSSSTLELEDGTTPSYASATARLCRGFLLLLSLVIITAYFIDFESSIAKRVDDNADDLESVVQTDISTDSNSNDVDGDAENLEDVVHTDEK